MYNQCEIVQDLLPLYVDGACSESSAAMIKDHLENCPQCKVLYEKFCSDSGEEMLKAEMVEVVAKHKHQVEKKRLLEITASVVITSAVAVLVICLLIWRLLPRSFSALMPADEDSIICFSAWVSTKQENGESGTEIYCLDHTAQKCNDPSEIIEILSAFSYQQDLRNLLPRGVSTVNPDENYDGRMVHVKFYTGTAATDCIAISFSSSSTMTIFVRGEERFQVYHPISHNTFDALIEYIQKHGEPYFLPNPQW